MLKLKAFRIAKTSIVSAQFVCMVYFCLIRYWLYHLFLVPKIPILQTFKYPLSFTVKDIHKLFQCWNQMQSSAYGKRKQFERGLKEFQVKIFCIGIFMKIRSTWVKCKPKEILPQKKNKKTKTNQAAIWIMNLDFSVSPKLQVTCQVHKFWQFWIKPQLLSS